jgi:hypothetical protein
MNETQDGETIVKPFSASETIGKLSAALAKAQGAIEGAKKDSENPFFHARYAALSSVWDACRGPLSKNGLAVVQSPGQNGEGLFVDSILSHSSGEWIASRLYVKPGYTDKEGNFNELSDSQALGSAITYARRYGLQALVGIAPMDDDGEAAMGRQHTREADASTRKDAPLMVSGRKPKPSVPEPKYADRVTPAGHADEIPADEAGTKPTFTNDEIPMFNGPKHAALAARLKEEGIQEDDLMSAAKFASLIPAAAKAFRLMSEATAAQFVDDPEVLKIIIENWRHQRVVA